VSSLLDPVAFVKGSASRQEAQDARSAATLARVRPSHRTQYNPTRTLFVR